MTRTRTALVTLMLVLAAVAPFAGTVAAGEIAVGVTQADDGTATVTVTHNGSALPNATVEVSSENASYAGSGTYTTDANGTVSLPAPSENVTVTVTATHENATASTTATLVATNTSDGEDGPETFGQKVSEFVHWLQSGGNMTPGAVAEFVTENNPGNAPDHAGPKDDAGASGNETDGPGNGHGPGGNSGNGPGNGNGQANGHDE